MQKSFLKISKQQQSSFSVKEVRSRWILSFFCVFFSIFLHGVVGKKIEAEHFVFNLTGTIHGNGDVVGGFGIAYGMKKNFPNADFTVLTDKRAVDVLSQVYGASLAELSERYDIHFVSREEAHSIATADFSFETFFGARLFAGDDEYDYLDMPYNHRDTIHFTCDSMHGYTLDEIRMREHSFYFKPAGLGSSRSGIIEDPTLSGLRAIIDGISRRHNGEKWGDLSDKALRRVELRKYIADTFFPKGSLISKVLRDSHIRIAFGYGTHNEVFKVSKSETWDIKDQTKAYLKYLDIKSTPRAPIIYITPNKPEKLLKAGVRLIAIEEGSAVEGQRDLYREGVSTLDYEAIQDQRSVSTVFSGKLNTQQFTALVAAADLPLWLEGNNSISNAILLGRPFFILRSIWNYPMIQDLINFEQLHFGTQDFLRAYPKDSDPDIEFLSQIIRKKASFFQRLSEKTGLFSDKLSQIVDLVKAFQTALISDAIGIEEKSTFIKALSYSAKEDARVSDQALSFSFAKVAHENNLIFQEDYSELLNHLAEDGLDPEEVLEKMVPNKPNESVKIEATKIGRYPDPIPVLLEEGKKYLFLEFPYNCAGLGNRLQAIVSAQLVAEASGRELVVAWPVDDSCKARFFDLFDNDFRVVTPHRMTITLERTEFKKIEGEERQRADILRKYKDDRILYLETVQLFADETLYRQDFDRIVQGLRGNLISLVPIKDVRERVKGFVHRNFLGKRLVGVHFRTWSKAVGDEFQDLTPPKIDDFFWAMDHELKVHPETVFFVATDDVGSRNQFLERFSSEKIIFSELEKAERKTLKGIKGALYEMLLLSKTHHIIGTTMSSFSDLAAMMTESSRKITIGNSPYRGDPLKTFCFARPTGILAPCDVNLETMRHYRPQP